MRQIIPAKDPLNLSIKVPGDKSISHRALMFTGFTDGESHIRHLGTGADIRSTMKVLRQLGLQIDYSSKKNSARVVAGGLQDLIKPANSLDAGNSGTTMRLMSGLLAGRPFESVLTGDESLRSRPMNRIVDPLRSMGASIKSTGHGTAPLEIRPARLTGIDYAMPVASAQVKSAIILAGLQADGHTIIREQAISRRHTEVMLGQFGAPIEIKGPVITLEGLSGPLAPYNFTVPGDPSSAAFWAAAAALIPGSSCQIEDVHLSEERIGFYYVLKEMGAHVKIQVADDTIEPRGNVKVSSNGLKGISLGSEDIPGIIDELPLVAVLGAYADGKTTVRDAKELRYKECDRIKAVVSNLRAMHVNIEEFEDGFELTGENPAVGADLNSYGDHRIAMAFGIAALGATGNSQMKNPDAASVSYPEYWQIIDSFSTDS